MKILSFPYTKKRIIDIRRSNDDFDKEYGTRLASFSASSTTNDFVDLISDYEEFFPSGIQSLRKITESDFKALFVDIHHMISELRKNVAINAKPTVALIITQPPMIVIPRCWAITQAHETGKSMTWGEAFLSLVSAGMVKKLEEQGEAMYRDIGKYDSISRS